MAENKKNKISDLIFITLHTPNFQKPIRLNPHGILYIGEYIAYRLYEKLEVIGSEIHLIDGSKVYASETNDEIYELIDNLKINN